MFLIKLQMFANEYRVRAEKEREREREKPKHENLCLVFVVSMFNNQIK